MKVEPTVPGGADAVTELLARPDIQEDQIIVRFGGDDVRDHGGLYEHGDAHVAVFRIGCAPRRESPDRAILHEGADAKIIWAFAETDGDDERLLAVGIYCGEKTREI